MSAEAQTFYSSMAATYSPDDNKLRLSSLSRLDQPTYERVKSAGFKWAPKQQIFVAPMWTPERAALLVELCGDIGDEDTTLQDRAVERAERFDTYSEKRATDGDRAYKAVSQLADAIPLGQPILVGHHSERRARKDAERIDNGMRKAVQMWETSEYWTRRAAGALAHAKYKERPDVRARRIKTIEADKRKMERTKAEAERFLALWSTPNLTHEKALVIANSCHLNLPRKDGDRPDFDGQPSAYCALSNSYPSLYAARTLEEVVDAAKAAYPKTIVWCDAWLTHYNNRLAYERAMLGDAGGTVAGNIGHTFEVGGQVLVRGQWVTILRVNRKGGQVTSLNTNRKYVSQLSAEEVQDYRAPDAETASQVKEAIKAPPLCNYPGDGFEHITNAEWKKKPNDYKCTRVVGGGRTGYEHSKGWISQDMADATAPHRIRLIMAGGCRMVAVYITDLKRTDAPKAAEVAERPTIPAPVKVATVGATAESLQPITKPAPKIDRGLLEATRDQVKAGVQVVSAPQLFPTPAALAARMVDLAAIPCGSRVLEPSAGTGAILAALPGVLPFGDIRQTWAHVVAVEVNHGLADRLKASGLAHSVICGDFLEFSDQQGFDRIVMNPPFVGAMDISHIKHAMTLLAPGGRLVAVCANGPRQQLELRQLVDQHGGTWEDLPPNTFEVSGTAVNTALIVIDV